MCLQQSLLHFVTFFKMSRNPNDITNKRDMSQDPTTHVELLDCLGSPRAIRERFARHGMRPPTHGAIRTWRYRKFIPARWLNQLVKIAKEDRLVRAPAKLLFDLTKEVA